MPEPEVVSILNAIKKPLGIDSEYDAFDFDIVMHINSAFSTLHQLGIGPAAGFEITGPNEKWVDFIGTSLPLNQVKTYVYIRVKLLFDPPQTSYAAEALKKQAN